MTKRKSKGAYMISAVAEMYDIHPQTLRLYEREGLLKPSRTEGNTRLYTDEDLQRLEFILSLARDLGVNISGIAIILQMRERMEETQRQIQDFVQYIQQEVLTRATAAADPSKGAIVPMRRPVVPVAVPRNEVRLGASATLLERFTATLQTPRSDRRSPRQEFSHRYSFERLRNSALPFPGLRAGRCLRRYRGMVRSRRETGRCGD